MEGKGRSFLFLLCEKEKERWGRLDPLVYYRAKLSRVCILLFFSLNLVARTPSPALVTERGREIKFRGIQFKILGGEVLSEW